MDYLKTYEIPNVDGFNPDRDAYAYEEEGRRKLFLDGVTLEKEELPSRLSYRKDCMYAWYSSGKFELYSGHTLLKSIKSNTHLLNKQTSYIGEHFLDLKNFESFCNLMSPVDEQPILTRFIPYDLYFENDVIIAYDNFKGELKRINTCTESLWEFPLSSLGDAPYAIGENDKIRKILGIVHNRLWFYTDFYRLVAIDIETGNWEFTFECFGVYLDDHTQNIYSIASNIMIEIDTQLLNIKEQYNFLESDPAGIGKYHNIFEPLLQGDYFTFTGEKPLESYGCGWIGIFDYKARKLVWEYELLPQEERKATRTYISPTDQLYMSGNKLYIKDSKRTLHIFERED